VLTRQEFGACSARLTYDKAPTAKNDDEKSFIKEILHNRTPPPVLRVLSSISMVTAGRRSSMNTRRHSNAVAAAQPPVTTTTTRRRKHVAECEPIEESVQSVEKRRRLEAVKDALLRGRQEESDGDISDDGSVEGGGGVPRGMVVDNAVESPQQEAARVAPLLLQQQATQHGNSILVTGNSTIVSALTSRTTNIPRSKEDLPSFLSLCLSTFIKNTLFSKVKFVCDNMLTVDSEIVTQCYDHLGIDNAEDRNAYLPDLKRKIKSYLIARRNYVKTKIMKELAMGT
jgi:hypothetical protein